MQRGLPAVHAAHARDRGAGDRAAGGHPACRQGRRGAAQRIAHRLDRTPAGDAALRTAGADPLRTAEMGARVDALRGRPARRPAGERRLGGAPAPARTRAGAGRRREVARRGRGRQPGQVDLPRHDEPRDPDADERRAGHDGSAGGRGRERRPGAHGGDHARIRPGLAAHHRRRARLLQDRGWRARPRRGAVLAHRPGRRRRHDVSLAGRAQGPVAGLRHRRQGRPTPCWAIPRGCARSCSISWATR